MNTFREIISVNLLDFCLLHYLLSSDSKAMAKVSKLHTSFSKTKKNYLVFYLTFVKGIQYL